MKFVHNDLDKCCGCSACANICPKNAITLSQNVKGFYYPEINESLCINCGLCNKVCNFIAFEKKAVVNQKSYAVRHKNEQELMTSRSGAFFSGLASDIISRGGIVYGSALTSECVVIHDKAETTFEITKFKGSKYVQSYIPKGMFIEIENILTSGRLVLFSGTGCQVHGLIQYLKTKKISMDNLITVDFVCHGVPSPKVWKDYITALSERKGQSIKSVNFRDKEKFGWAAHEEKYEYADGTVEYSSAWAEVFYLHCMFRDSCYVCPYTTPARESDFTIGDYWGLLDAAGEELYTDNKGVSLVICQSKKAESILHDLSDRFYITETDLLKSLQPQLRQAVYKGPEYNSFWKVYIKNAEIAMKKYFFPSRARVLYLLGYKKAKQAIKPIVITLKRIGK